MRIGFIQSNSNKITQSIAIMCLEIINRMLRLFKQTKFIPDQCSVNITLNSAVIIISVPLTKNPSLTVNRIFTFYSVSNLVIPACPASLRKPGWIVTSSPWLPYKNNIGIYFFCFFFYFLYCLPVNQLRKIKSETIDVVFFHPVKNTFNYQSPEHRSFSPQVIAGSAMLYKVSLFIDPEIVFFINLFQVAQFIF